MAKSRSASKKSTKPNKSFLDGLSAKQIFYVNTTLLAVAIVLLGLSLWTQNDQKDAPIPFAGYSKGVTVSMGSVAVKVSSVTSAAGKGHFVAPEGMKYLIVGLTIKNTSGKPINVLPSTDTYVKSTDGKVTNLTPYNLDQPFRAGELLPGEQISGQLSYLVAKDKSQKLYIDAIWSGGVIPIELQ